MKVALYLHAYQPPTQFRGVTKVITKASYEKIVEILLHNPKARITLNMVGSLTEQLVENKETKVLEGISYLAAQGQIELTGCAMYHPLLTKLPEHEIVRQNELNNVINQKTYGEDVYQPHGFFLPEMVYNQRVGSVLGRMGYEWIVLDESAYPYVDINANRGMQHLALKISRRLYKMPDSNLIVLYRDHPLSQWISFSKKISLDEVIEGLKEHYLNADEGYLVLAMDAETFGHHHKKRVRFLEEFLAHPLIEPVTIHELVTDPNYEVEEITSDTSTWGLLEEGDDHQRVFPRWDNPENPVQQKLWKLFYLAVTLGGHKDGQPDLLDKSINSDTFFWAGNNPCWHPKMVERGAALLRDVVMSSEQATEGEKEESLTLFSDINQTGMKLFGKRTHDC